MSAEDRAGVETLETENKYSQGPDALEVIKQNEIPSVEKGIERAFNEARAHLIGTELSNPLLNLGEDSSQTRIQISGEASDALFNILLKNEHIMTFAERAGTEKEFDPALPPAQPDVDLTDDILQTSHKGQEMQLRLLKTEHEAALHEEERGANALFLAFGVLEWKDTSEEKTYKAPLLLLPVSLTRESVDSKFTLKYNGQEVEENIALRRRLKDEYNITLPEVTSTHKLDPSQYFAELKDVLKSNSATQQFSIKPNDIRVGLFSFGRYHMYKDLDAANWPEGRKPWHNRIIRSIFDGGFVDAGPKISPQTRIDDAIDLSKRFDVLDVDSSQLRTLEEIRAGKSLRVWGPPGTGKSTSIVNIIANGVAQGKKILFVSEKRDALRVVKGWLDTAGIGDVALEMHSSVTKRSVMEELSRTLSLGKPISQDRTGLLKQVTALQTRLNAHHQLLQQNVRDSGVTGYEVVSNFIGQKSEQQRLKILSDPCMRKWEKTNFQDALEYAQKLDSYCMKFASPRKNPFLGVQKDSSSPVNVEAFQECVTKVQELVHKLSEGMKKLFRPLSLPYDLSEDNLGLTLQALTIVDDHYTYAGAMVKNYNLKSSAWIDREDAINRALAEQLRFSELVYKVENRVKLKLLQECPLEAVGEYIQKYSNKTFIGRFFDQTYPAALEELETVTSVPYSLNEQLSLVETLKELQGLQEQVLKRAGVWEKLLNISRKEVLDPKLRFWQMNAQVVYALQDFMHVTNELSCKDNLVELFKKPTGVYKSSEEIEAVSKLFLEYKKEREKLFSLLQYSKTAQEENFFAASIEDQEKIIDSWRFGTPALNAMQDFNSLIKEKPLLSFLSDEVLSSDSSMPNLAGRLNYSWYSDLTSDLLRTYAIASDFNGVTHEALIKQFADTDKKLMKANASEIAAKHWALLPREAIGGQAATLQAELQKRAGYMPLRKLFSEAGHAVQSVKPVFMMSPHTVAEYLDPKQIGFDIVIFDETSQLRPADAFGAMLRGSQVIACGDLKQLGPSDFFESGSGLSYSRDEHEKVEVESILELLREAHMPESRFSWHYRSKNPELIALSNSEFYDGSLKVFPSCQIGSSNEGLHYHYIKEGKYSAGSERVNIEEAREVAKAVIEHALSRPEESLGVVALNHPQMEAIQIEVEKLRRSNPEAERFFAMHSSEAFFVKNLESVQGDERDRIFVSVGFARDEAGKLALNFGPIIQKGGERRLNVLMTRAKLACEVFTSLNAREPELEASTNPGVVILRKFISQAANKISKELRSRNADLDPFQAAVKKAIEEKGYEVHANIGPVGSGVDLAVVDPNDAKKYILGIELDGKSFQSLDSARDRERIRQEVLKSRGWNLEHVWALDWNKSSSGQITKVLNRLEELQSKGSGRDKVKTDGSRNGREVRFIEREEAAQAENKLSQAYQVASLNGAHSQVKISKAKLLAEIVAIESPIHRDEAHKRLRENLGLKRETQEFAKTVGTAEAEALAYGKIISRGDFLYSPNKGIFPRDRSNLKGSIKEFNRISPDEIEATIVTVINNSCGISIDELPIACSKLLGYKKLPSGADAVIVDRLKELKHHNVISQENGLLTARDKTVLG